MQVSKYPKSSTNPYGLVVVRPDNYSANHPIIVHLHGVGGKGDGSSASLDSLVNGELPKELQAASDLYGFVIVAPQASVDWTNAEVDSALTWAKANLSVDWTRSYLLGLSFGGGGVTRYISTSVANATKFSAAVCVCGLNWLINSNNIVDAKLRMIFFHAQDDNVVNVSQTNNAVSAINGLNPDVPAKKIIYPAIGWGHYIWSPTYNSANNVQGETYNLYDWLLKNPSSSPVPTGALKANAGLDVVSADGNATLDGSASTGAISYLWIKALGKSDVKSANGWSMPTLKLYSVPAGDYEFELQVKDAAGNIAKDRVKLTVGSSSTGTTTTPTPVIKKVVLSFLLKSGKLLKVYDDDSTEVV
jgi:dienelactone hydrolase